MGNESSSYYAVRAGPGRRGHDGDLVGGGRTRGTTGVRPWEEEHGGGRGHSGQAGAAGMRGEEGTAGRQGKRSAGRWG